MSLDQIGCFFLAFPTVYKCNIHRVVRWYSNALANCSNFLYIPPPADLQKLGMDTSCLFCVLCFKCSMVGRWCQWWCAWDTSGIVKLDLEVEIILLVGFDIMLVLPSWIATFLLHWVTCCIMELWGFWFLLIHLHAVLKFKCQEGTVCWAGMPPQIWSWWMTIQNSSNIKHI